MSRDPDRLISEQARRDDRDRDLGREIARPLAATPDRSHRDRISWRGRTYRLSALERLTLGTIGTFRVIADRDLQRFVYDGDGGRLRSDLRSLAAQQLIERHSVPDGTWPNEMPVTTLSKSGHAFGARRLAGPDHMFHRGVVNPKEIRHDAALYRLYHVEAARIENRGGHVLRVLLDAELKHRVFASLRRPEHDRLRADHEAAEAHRRAVASAFGLAVVDGVIPLPDLRLEYEITAGERCKVDVELATTHYAPAKLAAKARAGFRMYALEHDVGWVATTLAERGIVAEILSL